MSFPRHAKYMDSGVDWLGQIPSHWAVKRLRFVAELNPSKSEVSHLAADTEVSFLPMEAIGEDGSLELDRVRPLADVQTGYTFFRDGDVTIAKITPCFENGKGAAMRDLCNGIGFGTTELIVTRPKAAQTTSTYLHWLFTSRPFRKAGEAFMYGAGGQKRVPDDFVRDFAIGFPPLPEQCHIVTFLDRETAKIDALVEEQRRLIELLKEKRQAVISRAVTKGLNPNVLTKDSGVEWLGEVPAHWQPIQLGRVCRQVSDGPHFSPQYVDDGVMFLSARNLSVDSWHLEDAKFVSEVDYLEFSKRVIPEIGDVLYTKGGTTGIARVVDLPMRFQVWVHIAVLKLDRTKSDPYFIAYALNSVGCYEQSQLSTRGATNQDLGLTRMIRIWLALPPLTEQREIAAWLSDETRRMNALVVESESALSILRERRTALISAAVTGKIDVRDLAPQPQALAA